MGPINHAILGLSCSEILITVYYVVLSRSLRFRIEVRNRGTSKFLAGAAVHLKFYTTQFPIFIAIGPVTMVAKGNIRIYVVATMTRSR